MFFQQYKVEGLGCYSYLIGCPAAEVGFVVDPEPRAIARQIRALLADAELRRTIGTAAARSIPRARDAGSMASIFQREFAQLLEA